MPNHVDNTVTVLGTEEDVAEFIRCARGVHPPTGDKEEANSDVARPKQSFSFHALVPLPAEYSTVSYSPNYANRNGANGYDMEYQTWGIKWGAYDHREPTVDPGVATYRFQTAWSAPHAVFLPKVAQRFKRLTFLLSWGGEGPTRGRAVFYKNTKIGGGDEYKAEDYPLGEDTDWDAYQAVQNIRQTTHDLWVGWTVARLAGRTFDVNVHPGILADWLDEAGLAQLAAAVRALPPDTNRDRFTTWSTS